MESLIFEIGLMRDSEEKDILSKAYFDARKYVKEKDKDALKAITYRLNSVFPQMSRKAQNISLALVQTITEECEKI